MASGARSGVGTKLYRKGTSWAAFAEVNNISGPNATKETIDVTSLDSTGGWREFIGSFKDGGEVTFDLNFTYANYELALEDFKSETPKLYRIVIPDTEKSTLMYRAVTTGCPLSIPSGDKITISITHKISGEPQFYSSASTTVTNLP